MPPHAPTIASILQALAVAYDGPVSEREVMDRVLEQRPSSAKNPYAAIREKLRWQGPLLGWVRLGDGSLLPLRVVLHNLCFRCIPDEREVHLGLLDLSKLAPFVRLPDDIGTLEDASGTRMPIKVVPLRIESEVWNGDTLHPRLDLSGWYRATGFSVGDSIVITIVESQPLVLRLRREPAHEFRAAAVERQDAELREAIWTQVQRAQSAPLHSAEAVLPAFARAPWRTGYPGHPWQALVQHDPRMGVLDSVYVAQRDAQPMQEPLPVENGHASMLTQAAAALLREIEQLQAQLRASRQRDLEAGVWDGTTAPMAASRSSTDDVGGASGILSIGPTDFDDADLKDDDAWDEDDWEDTLETATPSFPWDLDGEQDPDLIAASQRLLAALTPDEVERLQRARPEEAELIIAGKLNHLLVHEPSLFVTIARPGEPGNYAVPTYLDTTDAELEDEAWDESWEDDHNEDAWEEDVWSDGNEPEQPFTRSDVLVRQFYDFMRESGKSEQTARSRTNDLWIYAEFLARTYNRTLDQGDYATLDECLFFFYPHKVMPRSARCVKNLCTSLKQFYDFLKHRGVIADDTFAQALWRRRDEAAQVVEMYNRISSDWPDAGLLAERLFAPYVP